MKLYAVGGSAPWATSLLLVFMMLGDVCVFDVLDGMGWDGVGHVNIHVNLHKPLMHMPFQFRMSFLQLSHDGSGIL